MAWVVRSLKTLLYHQLRVHAFRFVHKDIGSVHALTLVPVVYRQAVVDYCYYCTIQSLRWGEDSDSLPWFRPSVVIVGYPAATASQHFGGIMRRP